jgi:hypothetical protein
MYLPGTVVNMYRDPNGVQSKATTLDTLHILGEVAIAPPVPKVKRGRKRNKRIESQSSKRRGSFGERKCPICKKRDISKRHVPLW